MLNKFTGPKQMLNITDINTYLVDSFRDSATVLDKNDYKC